MNLDTYTTEMAKSVWDKAFFMDKIPGVKCIIDFGCADGAMIRFLAPLFPDITFVGFDISDKMISMARSKKPFYPNVMFFKHHTDVIDYAKRITTYDPSEICINFSSVLHEVFSSTDGRDTIIEMVDELQPKYITIRDMYCDDPVEFFSMERVGTLVDSIAAYEDGDINQRFREFTDKFGTLKNWRDAAHLMMKLQWKHNGWEEELKENYFSWTLDDIFKLCPHYSTMFECRYQLPYLTEQWKLHYNWYNPDIHTHAQFILRRDI